MPSDNLKALEEKHPSFARLSKTAFDDLKKYDAEQRKAKTKLKQKNKANDERLVALIGTIGQMSEALISPSVDPLKLVDRDGNVVQVPTAVAQSFSPVLKEAITGPMQESRTKMYKLPEFDPQVVKCLAKAMVIPKELWGSLLLKDWAIQDLLRVMEACDFLLAKELFDCTVVELERRGTLDLSSDAAFMIMQKSAVSAWKGCWRRFESKAASVIAEAAVTNLNDLDPDLLGALEARQLDVVLSQIEKLVNAREERDSARVQLAVDQTNDAKAAVLKVSSDSVQVQVPVRNASIQCDDHRQVFSPVRVTARLVATFQPQERAGSPDTKQVVLSHDATKGATVTTCSTNGAQSVPLALVKLHLRADTYEARTVLDAGKLKEASELRLHWTATQLPVFAQCALIQRSRGTTLLGMGLYLDPRLGGQESASASVSTAVYKVAAQMLHLLVDSSLLLQWSPFTLESLLRVWNALHTNQSADQRDPGLEVLKMALKWARHHDSLSTGEQQAAGGSGASVVKAGSVLLERLVEDIDLGWSGALCEDQRLTTEERSQVRQLKSFQSVIQSVMGGYYKDSKKRKREEAEDDHSDDSESDDDVPLRPRRRVRHF